MRVILNLPETLKDDLELFREKTRAFGAGEISHAEYRAFRVPQGVYEQRVEGMHMLRVRLPAGAMLPAQMRTLASVASTYGNGILHVTSRQDIQVHGVPLENIHPALVELLAAGLSTKGGGGNTVRNITACPHAGVCAHEAFDVTAHAVALTEFLLPDPASYRLPRKYKIAFSGCPADCAGGGVNDLGLIARTRGNDPGFAVYVGGGMGTHARVGELLHDFVPTSEVHLVAEAVKRVFDKHGDRENRHKARLRFLVERIGLREFTKLYEAERAKLRTEAPPAPALREVRREERLAPGTAAPALAGFETWQAANTAPQRQEGYCLAHIPLVLGDITAYVLKKLADVIEELGEGMVRVTQAQNLEIRWVHVNELAALHAGLADLELADAPAPVLRNMVACTGASTCRLGLCLSRGLASAIADALRNAELALAKFGDLRIHISGCPNSCGRHPIADIGFFGVVRQVNGRGVPHYVVQLGGRLGEGKARLAEGKDAIPARNVPAFLVDFLRAFRESTKFPDYEAFLVDGGRAVAAELAARHKPIPAFEEDKTPYCDWGTEEPFSLAGRGGRLSAPPAAPGPRRSS